MKVDVFVKKNTNQNLIKAISLKNDYFHVIIIFSLSIIELLSEILI